MGRLILPVRFFWVFVVVALTAGAVGVSKLSFAVDLLDMLPKLPEIEGLRAYERHFVGKDQLMIGVESSDAATAEKAAETLAAALGAAPELVSSVRWRSWADGGNENASELAAYLIANADTARVAKTVGGLTADTMRDSLDRMATSFDIAEVERLSADPLQFLDLLPLDSLMDQENQAKLQSADGTLRLILVRWKTEPVGYREIDAWVKKIQSVQAAWASENPDLAARTTVLYSGDPAFRAEVSMVMEKDMSGSIILTNVGVLLLFWLVFRRFAPMAAIFLTLVCVLSLALCAGGFLFGSLNIMSMGFAAILIGLVVDYAVILYQEARGHSSPEGASVLAASGKSIFWASLSTAVVFGMLTFSSLPGLGQLGLLVALGILIGAVCMGFVFSPVAAALARRDPMTEGKGQSSRWPFRFWTALAIAALGFLIATQGPPRMETGMDSIQMRDTRAYADTMRITKKLDDGKGDFVPLIVTGTQAEMPARLAALRSRCQELRQKGVIRSFAVPDFLWPNAANWKRNLVSLGALWSRVPEWKKDAAEAGFEPSALALTERLTDHWKTYATEPNLVAPDGAYARSILREFIHVDPDDSAVMAAIQMGASENRAAVVEKFADHPGVSAAEWRLLAPSLRRLIDHDISVVYPLAACALLLFLWLSFRNFRDLLVGVVGLAAAFCILMALMKASGLAADAGAHPDTSLWRFFSVFGHWNLLNLTAVPLLLGTGVDYLIHIVFALRRNALQGGIGRALLFCAGSTAIGFASLGLSTHPGLRSMGVTCALGILIVFCVSRWMVPGLWRLAHRTEISGDRSRRGE